MSSGCANTRSGPIQSVAPQQNTISFNNIRNITVQSTTRADLDEYESDFWSRVDTLQNPGGETVDAGPTINPGDLDPSAGLEAVDTSPVFVQPAIVCAVYRSRCLYDDVCSGVRSSEPRGTAAVTTEAGDASTPRKCKCRYTSCKMHSSPASKLNVARYIYILDAKDNIHAAAARQMPTMYKIPPLPRAATTAETKVQHVELPVRTHKRAHIPSPLSQSWNVSELEATGSQLNSKE